MIELDWTFNHSSPCGWATWADVCFMCDFFFRFCNHSIFHIQTWCCVSCRLVKPPGQCFYAEFQGSPPPLGMSHNLYRLWDVDVLGDVSFIMFYLVFIINDQFTHDWFIYTYSYLWYMIYGDFWYFFLVKSQVARLPNGLVKPLWFFIDWWFQRRELFLAMLLMAQAGTSCVCCARRKKLDRKISSTAGRSTQLSWKHFINLK